MQPDNNFLAKRSSPCTVDKRSDYWNKGYFIDCAWKFNASRSQDELCNFRPVSFLSWKVKRKTANRSRVCVRPNQGKIRRQVTCHSNGAQKILGRHDKRLRNYLPFYFLLPLT